MNLFEMDDIPDEKKRIIEREYVRSTYDKIAESFSNTRYKKWPKVEAFLASLPKYSLCLDVGCGNGKYLDNAQTFNIGCDISLNLLNICKYKKYEVLMCDMMTLPFREGLFDSIICIAALHHIVSSQRRKRCILSMLELLSVGGFLFIQVWSFEQKLEGPTKYLKRLDQDKSNCQEGGNQQVFVADSINLHIHQNRTPFSQQEMLVPFKSKEQGIEHLRYYHLFRENELEGLFSDIPGVTIKKSFYDQGNWCAIVVKDE